MKRAILAMLVACTVTPPPRAAVEPDPFAVTRCADACAMLLHLGCEEGLPAANGKECTVVCTEVLTSRESFLDTQCVATASDILTVRACGLRCKNKE